MSETVAPDVTAADGDVAFVDPAKEQAYLDASKLLSNPPASTQKVQLLVFSLVAFAAASFAQDTVQSLVELGMLVGVLLVHELGHVVGMRAYGYRDVKMFFIPFFGAAASGRKRGVERWKEGVVLLLGPLPGIAIGTVLAYIPDGPPELRTLAIMFIAVNVINLLPIAALDGGQLFSVMLFSRHRHLEIAFLAITAALVVIAGVLWSMWFVAIIGGLMLIAVPHRKAVLAVARTLPPGMPKDPAQLTDAQRRALFDAVFQVVPAQHHATWRAKPAAIAPLMEELLDRATQVPPSANASVALGAVWFAALLVAAVGIGEALPKRPSPGTPVPSTRVAEWRPVHHEAPAFTIEMPGEPATTADDQGGMLITLVGNERSYSVSWRRPGDEAWLAAQNKVMLERGRVISDNRIDEHERISIVELPEGRGIEIARVMVVGDVGYLVSVVAPEEEQPSLRFIYSFKPR